MSDLKALRAVKPVKPVASRYGNMTGVLMHACQGAGVHEGSSHVTIPSVDSIVHEFNLRGFSPGTEACRLQHLTIPNIDASE